MPELAIAPNMTRVDWELFETEYPEYLDWLEEQEADELARLDNMYRYALEEEDDYDADFPF